MKDDFISESSVASVINNVFEAAYYVNRKRKILNWNRYAEILSGFSRGEVITTYCHANILNHVDRDGNPLCKDGCPLHQTLETGKINNARVFLHHKNGHRVPVIIRTIPVYSNGRIEGAIEFFKKDSEHFNFYEFLELNNETFYLDSRNDIPNRRYVEEQFKEFIKEWKYKHEKFALVLFDIDDLGVINKEYSQSLGDEVIYMIAQTLITNIGNHDILGMWDSQDFIGLLKYVDTNDLNAKLETLKTLVEKSILRKEYYEVSTTVSAGCIPYSKGDLLENVLEAKSILKQSKLNGKNLISYEK